LVRVVASPWRSPAEKGLQVGLEGELTLAQVLVDGSDVVERAGLSARVVQVPAERENGAVVLERLHRLAHGPVDGAEIVEARRLTGAVSDLAADRRCHLDVPGRLPQISHGEIRRPEVVQGLRFAEAETDLPIHGERLTVAPERLARLLQPITHRSHEGEGLRLVEPVARRAPVGESLLEKGTRLLQRLAIRLLAKLGGFGHDSKGSRPDAVGGGRVPKQVDREPVLSFRLSLSARRDRDAVGPGLLGDGSEPLGTERVVDSHTHQSLSPRRLKGEGNRNGVVLESECDVLSGVEEDRVVAACARRHPAFDRLVQNELGRLHSGEQKGSQSARGGRHYLGSPA
jgi:hypothetical protein